MIYVYQQSNQKERECVETSESGDDPRKTVCSSRTVACPFWCTRQPAQIRSEDDFQSHNGKFYSGERKVGGLHPEARGAS